MHLEKLFAVLQAMPGTLVQEAAKEAEAVYAAAGELPAAKDRIATLEERLKKAMERENAYREALEKAAENERELGASNKELANEVQKLQAQIEGMKDHPDVKAAEAARLELERAAIERRLKQLRPQVPEPEAEPKDEKPESGSGENENAHREPLEG